MVLAVFVSTLGLGACAVSTERVSEERSQLADDPDEGGQAKGKRAAIAPQLVDDPDEGGQIVDGCTYRFGWNVTGVCQGGMESRWRVDVYRCHGKDEERVSRLPSVPCSNNPPQQP
jgi:hypothetical protein